MSRQAGSKWRSYQATYSSTIALVAGCVVTSSTSPSPSTQTLRPSRSASRYSAPVRICFPLLLGMPEMAEPGRDDIAIGHIVVENAHAAGELIDRRHRFLADRGVVEWQITADDAGDEPGLARREALLADFGGARHVRLQRVLRRDQRAQGGGGGLGRALDQPVGRCQHRH